MTEDELLARSDEQRPNGEPIAAASLIDDLAAHIRAQSAEIAQLRGDNFQYARGFNDGMAASKEVCRHSDDVFDETIRAQSAEIASLRAENCALIAVETERQNIARSAALAVTACVRAALKGPGA